MLQLTQTQTFKEFPLPGPDPVRSAGFLMLTDISGMTPQHGHHWAL